MGEETSFVGRVVSIETKDGQAEYTGKVIKHDSEGIWFKVGTDPKDLNWVPTHNIGTIETADVEVKE